MFRPLRGRMDGERRLEAIRFLTAKKSLRQATISLPMLSISQTPLVGFTHPLPLTRLADTLLARHTPSATTLRKQLPSTLERLPADMSPIDIRPLLQCRYQL